MSREEALRLFERQSHVHLATTAPDGAPVLRALHMVVSDGMLCFHGAPVGEKHTAIGREAVVCAEEVVAEVPSYWSDPELACPATTLYLSAQTHGPIIEVTDPAARARALQRLMERYQPEGGHARIEHDDPRYTKSVAGLFIAGVSLDRLDGKGKLAQNRTPTAIATILERLWERGREGDARAVALVMRANPKVPRPTRFVGPHGATLEPSLEEGDLSAALSLVRDEYWNAGRFDDDAIARSHRQSAAWVGARGPDGSVIATARAVSDGVKFAYVADVAVHPEWRGKGVGEALMGLLLDHPMLRGAARVELATRDAMRFYERFGFEVSSQEKLADRVRTVMVRRVRR